MSFNLFLVTISEHSNRMKIRRLETTLASKSPLFASEATGLTRKISVLPTIPLPWLCLGAGISTLIAFILKLAFFPSGIASSS